MPRTLYIIDPDERAALQWTQVDWKTLSHCDNFLKAVLRAPSLTEQDRLDWLRLLANQGNPHPVPQWPEGDYNVPVQANLIGETQSTSTTPLSANPVIGPVPNKRARSTDLLADEPSLKVPKNETTVPLPTIKTRSRSPLPEGFQTTSSMDDQPLTRPQQNLCINTIIHLAKSKEAMPFTRPVNEYDLDRAVIKRYFRVINKPMDLRTMKEKLRAKRYKTINDVLADMDQMVKNSFIFNSQTHLVTKDALKIREVFVNSLKESPLLRRE